MSELTVKPARFLFLNHNVVRRGGTFYRAFEIARLLQRRGHSVTLFSISPESRFGVESEIVDGVEILHTPDLFWGIGRSGWDPWDTAVRIMRAWRDEWDVIHAWDSRPVVILPALAARFASRRRHAKLFIDWSDWWGRGGTQSERGGGWTRHLYSAIETFFEERFRRFADGTTVISTPLRDRAIRLGVPPERIMILPQGCERPTTPLISRAAALRELELDESTLLFVTVGVLNVSDAVLLYDAIRKVLQQVPSARFVIAGRSRTRLPDDLRAAGTLEVGFVSDSLLATYMAAANAVVVPLADTISSRARWPSRVNHSLSSGVPVVVTCVGDFPNLLRRENAAFVAQATADDLARNILLAANDPAAVDRVKREAGRVAAELLPWDRLISGLENFYFATSSSAPVQAFSQIA